MRVENILESFDFDNADALNNSTEELKDSIKKIKYYQKYKQLILDDIESYKQKLIRIGEWNHTEEAKTRNSLLNLFLEKYEFFLGEDYGKIGVMYFCFLNHDTIRLRKNYDLEIQPSEMYYLDNKNLSLEVFLKTLDGLKEYTIKAINELQKLDKPENFEEIIRIVNQIIGNEFLNEDFNFDEDIEDIDAIKEDLEYVKVFVKFKEFLNFKLNCEINDLKKVKKSYGLNEHFLIEQILKIYTDSDLAFLAYRYSANKGERNIRMIYKDFDGNVDYSELIVIKYKNKNLSDLDVLKKEEEGFIEELCKKLAKLHNKELAAYIKNQLDGEWQKIMDGYKKEIYESFDFENAEDDLSNDLKKEVENIKIINEFKDFLITRITNTVDFLRDKEFGGIWTKKSVSFSRIYSDYNIFFSKKGPTSLGIEIYCPIENSLAGSIKIIKGIVDSMALNFHKDLDELERIHKRLVIYIINLIQKSEYFDEYIIYLKKVFKKWKAKYQKELKSLNESFDFEEDTSKDSDSSQELKDEIEIQKTKIALLSKCKNIYKLNGFDVLGVLRRQVPNRTILLQFLRDCWPSLNFYVEAGNNSYEDYHLGYTKGSAYKEQTIRVNDIDKNDLCVSFKNFVNGLFDYKKIKDSEEYIEFLNKNILQRFNLELDL